MPGFTPTDLAELSVWMDASTLLLPDSDPVSSWPDSSGNAVDVDIVGSPDPVYRASALNGRGVVRFEANEGRIRGSNAADSTGTFMVFGIARLTSGSVGRVFSGVYAPNNILVGWHSSQSTLSAYAGAFITGGSTYDTDFHLLTYSQTAGTGTLYEAGALVNSAGSQGQTYGTQFGFSGYDLSSDAESCDCEVAEWIVVAGSIDTDDRQLVEGYLAWKWGLEGDLPVDHPHKDVNPGQTFTISGVTRTGTGAVLGGVTVKAYRTSTDRYAGVTTSGVDGTYSLDVGTDDAHYCVGYLDGDPDLTGATVNTLTGTV